MFDRYDMAKIIGYNDGFFGEPNHAGDFDDLLMRFDYHTGYYGAVYSRLKTSRKRFQRSYLDMFFLGSR